jgi:tetratricopeptide (TPR) repeat protein
MEGVSNGVLLNQIGQVCISILHPLLLTIKTNIFYGFKKFNLALTYFQRAVDIFLPPHLATPTRIPNGNTYLQLGSPSEAMHYLNLAKSLTPAEPDVYLSLGKTYLLLYKSDRREALKCFTTALSLNPQVSIIKYPPYERENLTNDPETEPSYQGNIITVCRLLRAMMLWLVVRII